MRAGGNPFSWAVVLLLLGGLAVGDPAQAAPRVTVERTWQQLQSELAHAPAEWARNPRPIERWVRRELARHWDLSVAARRIAAQRSGAAPDPAAVERLAAALREWLGVRVASLVSSHLELLRAQLTGAGGALTVQAAHMTEDRSGAMLTAVLAVKAGRWPLSLHLRRGEEGWRLYDVETAGIGLVQYLQAAVTRESPRGSADDAAAVLRRDVRRIRSGWPRTD